ncbi:MAG: outer membrane beta-barrel protein [Flavisolibacter sp.]
MYNRCLLLTIILIVSCSPCILAQGRFELGIEFGATNDQYDFNDPGGHLRNISAVSGSGGLNFRLNLNKKLFIETALIFRNSQFGFRFQSEQGGRVTNQDELLMLPIRAGYNLHLSEKIKLGPVIGIAPVYKMHTGSTAASGGFNNNNTTVFYSYTEKNVGKDVFLLLQGGLSIDYIFSGKWRLSFNPNYYYGFKTINIHEMDYSVTTPSGFKVSKSFINGYGSFIHYNFGIRYFLGKKTNN